MSIKPEAILPQNTIGKSISRPKTRYQARLERKWVSVFFADRDFDFCEAGGHVADETWHIKSLVDDEKHVAGIATGVFDCVQVKGDDVGKQAVMKIHMQTAGRAKQKLPYWVADEVRALQHMNAQSQEIPVPRLIKHTMRWQREKLWVNGAFIAILIMDKLPGESLSMESFQQKSYSEREDIRHAFWASIQQVRGAAVSHMDPRLSNLLWDKENKQCYIIDFEGAFLHEKGQFYGSEYEGDIMMWDLTEEAICHAHSHSRKEVYRRGGPDKSTCPCQKCQDKYKNGQHIEQKEDQDTSNKVIIDESIVPDASYHSGDSTKESGEDSVSEDSAESTTSSEDIETESKAVEEEIGIENMAIVAKLTEELSSEQIDKTLAILQKQRARAEKKKCKIRHSSKST